MPLSELPPEEQAWADAAASRLRQQERQLDNETAEAIKLTDEQKAAVEKGREEIAKGEYLTDAQANEEIDQWLNGRGK